MNRKRRDTLPEEERDGAGKGREEAGRGWEREHIRLKHEVGTYETVTGQPTNLCNQCQFKSVIKFENKEVERRLVAARD